MADRLGQVMRHRHGFASGGITATERQSLDFVINGQPYLEMLDRARGSESDLMGCFVVGFADENQRAAARLLMEEAPDSPSGRVIVYACAECADIGCGAYTVRVSQQDGKWVWGDCAWENGYEEPQPLELPSFEFSNDNYRAVVLAGRSIA